MMCMSQAKKELPEVCPGPGAHFRELGRLRHGNLMETLPSCLHSPQSEHVVCHPLARH